MAAFFHRKILQKLKKPKVIIREQDCNYYADCHDISIPPLPTPLPTPPPLSRLSSSDHPLSLYLIILLCGLAVSFSFICFLILSAVHRRRQRNHENIDEIHEDFVNEDHGPVIHHHIWLINTIGLDQSQIDSIQVIKYKKDEGLIEGTDCSVCLSEFEDDESLRLLPKCSHAFHVPCIDTWLRSHKNCPLCRAPIVKNTTHNQTDHHATIEMTSASIESRTSNESEGEESETIDHHVVEVENNGEMEKTCSGVRVQSDLADRHRVQEEEFVATRRSVSMDEFSDSTVHFEVARHSSRQLVMSKKPMVINSMPKGGHKLKGPSSSISIRSRIMKSSSIGHSSRKASSFTKRSYSSNGKGSHNRSY